jgi:hypothetical protein
MRRFINCMSTTLARLESLPRLFSVSDRGHLITQLMPRVAIRPRPLRRQHASAQWGIHSDCFCGEAQRKVGRRSGVRRDVIRTLCRARRAI